MEEKQEQPKEGKKPSLLWPMLLWPLVGVPFYWVCVVLFSWGLPPPPPPDPHYDASIDLRAFGYSAMLIPVLCFGIGAFLGIHWARQPPVTRKAWLVSLLLGCAAAVLGLVYAFGPCALCVGGQWLFNSPHG